MPQAVDAAKIYPQRAKQTDSFGLQVAEADMVPHLTQFMHQAF